MTDTRVIEIRMGESAADSLADACAWGAVRAMEVLETEAHALRKAPKAQDAYDWLSWGERWLKNPDVRVDYDKALQDTIEELRRQLRTTEARLENQRGYARDMAARAWRNAEVTVLSSDDLLTIVLDAYEEAMQ